MIIWPDNETSVDLLGFRAHCALVQSVVTDQSVLPITLGVFGDWGGGKSSLMKMLQQELDALEESGVVCLSFNGWMFEGYDDAKSALISAILLQLGEHKRIGPAIRDKIVPLLKRIRWMRALALVMKHVALPLAAQHFAGDTATAAALLPFLPVPVQGVTEPSDQGGSESGEQPDWSSIISKDSSNPGPMDVRGFREQFARLLEDSNIRSLVVLVDDLDRCSPERIVENLEAIKLFLAVPRTAFVIGADPRIVRHAIAVRYDVASASRRRTAAEEPYDLVTDYLEKLIQIPYHLPRLSPSEIETYINLLLCQRHLDSRSFALVLDAWTLRRGRNQYACCRYGEVAEMMESESIPEPLARELAWSNAIAPALAEGMKGNPRQVKRMLNAMVLRRELAQTAGIAISDDVLAKLMVLEYLQPELFLELYQWQAAQGGFPAQLQQMEEAAFSDAASVETSLPENWREASVQRWLRMSPPLASVDLRDYFWVARDRTPFSAIGARMLSPLVRRIYAGLVSESRGEQHAAAKEAKALAAEDLEALLGELASHIKRAPDDAAGASALLLLFEGEVPKALSTLTAALLGVPVSAVPPNLPRDLGTLARSKPIARDLVVPLLQTMARDDSPTGRAAQNALEEIS